MFKKGDYVTRKKYGNDIVFIIDNIDENNVFLKGVDIRLIADANINDIVLTSIPKKKDENLILRSLNKEKFFYIPGLVLHIDSDKEYLNRCLKYYNNQHVSAYGIVDNEENFSSIIEKNIRLYSPNIVVITGHDAYYKNMKAGYYYKNSKYFAEAVKTAKKVSNDIIVFAGACQSDFENLIKSGSTYASSPERINIHALDPAIVASYLALTENTKNVDVEQLVNKTHYGSKGIGGVITCGTMKCGFPRKEKN